ncbi:4-hydroxybenzoate octaprenyltransferase [Bowmanella pacifica]|uniref:4-hydroxybenzoate octaprenyltransferase n=3 Tax=Bowmanella TaxID=366580 RepID=A0A918DKG0_9ALTE|nr:4-hydroxybenzoate octaprenyltransferase [Bowmanella pacifica]GGO71817.1 4-hydroxybenzoate octaprenyltransferase [Bowmanella pacifica]
MLSRNKLTAYARLARMDKPIGTYLLLWPTWWALWMSVQGTPDWSLLIIFSLGVFFMRSAGCVINDYADRHVDGEVKRTAQRPLVSGQLSEKEALGFFALLVLLSFLLVLLLNWQTILLSFGALALAACYPFMKRFTNLPQFVLGAAFSWAIPMAFMASLETLPWWSWWLFVANLLWTVAYDTMYAMVDRDDDLRIGVKSTAILFGRHDKLIIGLLQAITLAILVWLGVYLSLGMWYFAGWVVAVFLSGYQQWLIAGRERDPCFRAFLNNHYLGMAVTIGLILDLSF